MRGKDIDGELFVTQEPDSYYAIWGDSLAPTEHCVMLDADATPRLSLTLRYVVATAARPPGEAARSHERRAEEQAAAQQSDPPRSPTTIAWRGLGQQHRFRESWSVALLERDGNYR